VTDLDDRLAAAIARPFTGWDFSWVADRMTIEPPWDYTQLVLDAARDSPDLLDMGTGGGEWLAGLPARPWRTIATEAFEPNVALAARTLRSIGGSLVRDEGAPDNEDQHYNEHGQVSTGRLAFRSDAFTLVVNRHEAFVAREVARILAPGGVFLTQQVDNNNLYDCAALFAVEPPPLEPSWLPVAVAQVEAAGLIAEDARSGVERYEFSDVGALVWYLRAVVPQHPEWADFDPLQYRDALVRLDHRMQHGDPVAIRERRLLLRARS
jgi:SAM-dependent methyltransferase